MREVQEASLGHSPVEIMGQDPQVPVVDRLVPSLVAFVAVVHVSATSPSLLVVDATFLSLVPARLGGRSCQPALRRLSHSGPNGRRHHNQLRLQGRRVEKKYVALLLCWMITCLVILRCLLLPMKRLQCPRGLSNIRAIAITLRANRSASQ